VPSLDPVKALSLTGPRIFDLRAYVRILRWLSCLQLGAADLRVMRLIGLRGSAVGRGTSHRDTAGIQPAESPAAKPSSCPVA
jgi:hypothetical protein